MVEEKRATRVVIYSASKETEDILYVAVKEPLQGERETNTWGLLGGEVHAGEQESDAIVRQLREILGDQLTAEFILMESAFAFEAIDQSTGWVTAVYLLQLDRVVQLVDESDQKRPIGWFGLVSAVLHLPMTSNHADILTQAHIHLTENL